MQQAPGADLRIRLAKRLVIHTQLAGISTSQTFGSHRMLAARVATTCGAEQTRALTWNILLCSAVQSSPVRSQMINSSWFPAWQTVQLCQLQQ